MTYEELIIGVKEWADERGIDKKENVKSQFLKLVEEFGEYAYSMEYAGHAEIADSIGDIQVVLIILCEQLNIDYKYALRIAINAPLSVKSYEDMIKFALAKSDRFRIADMLIELMIELGKLSNEINKKNNSYDSVAIMQIGKLQLFLILASYFVAIKYKNALETAYGVIANRKGKMIDGSFVKEEDLND